MAELQGIPLNRHLVSIVDEFHHSASVYGYQSAKFFKGFNGYDFSTELYGRRVSTPLGPAAGPHTQLAQNIILSYLHGSRIIELKTVQISDQLKIPRPCIDIRNIGFNVEWSQELSLQESYKEYVSAWTLLHLLKELDILQQGSNNDFYNAIFDVSVGYDLKGISSPQMHSWIEGMKDAGDAISSLLEHLPPRFAHLKKAPIPPRISDSVTLSTFHGCPPDEIEEIVKYLISEHNVHVVVKMNPTLAGLSTVQSILHDQLGYRHIQLEPSAFENDLSFEQALAMMHRLQLFAAGSGRTVGVKFTNTLVVKNTETIFNEPLRYLSGAPLFVIAMHLVRRFREKFDEKIPVSFSGGINKDNFSQAVSCGLTPVTTCTDLLKKGGYRRLYAYLNNLRRAMEELNVQTLPDFIRASAGISDAGNMEQAIRYNTKKTASSALTGKVYHYNQNALPPKKIDSTLKLFDCLSCNICLPVCPNAANFSYQTAAVEWTGILLQVSNGRMRQVMMEPFILQKETQIGNIADFCNECGNCDTYCPEYGGPYIEKARFFLSRASFMANPSLNGFYFESAEKLLARFGREEFTMLKAKSGTEYLWQGRFFNCRIDEHNTISEFILTESGKRNDFSLEMTVFYSMRIVMEGIERLSPQYPSTLLLRRKD